MSKPILDWLNHEVAARLMAHRSTSEIAHIASSEASPDRFQPLKQAYTVICDMTKQGTDPGMNNIGGCSGYERAHFRRTSHVLGKKPSEERESAVDHKQPQSATKAHKYIVDPGFWTRQ